MSAAKPKDVTDIHSIVGRNRLEEEVRNMIVEVPIPAAITARSIADFHRPPDRDVSELLRNRFLCKGGGLLFVGPTGIGKSALEMQCAMSWAVNRHCLQIYPARALRSLIIQAENDDGDIGEMRDGVERGLSLTSAENKLVRDNVLIYSEDSRSATDFLLRTVEPLLANHKPDLLWIDPALAYLGGEASAQKDVSHFLRNGLNPLLHSYNCAAVVVHHTNKPASGREKAEWRGGDLAYLGSGSIEWANWARAVIAMRSIGEHGHYKLHLAKRGNRVGWVSEWGESEYEKFISHSKEPGTICWRESDPGEVEAVKERKGAPKRFTAQDLLDVLAGDELTTTEWRNSCETERKMGKTTFNDLKADLVEHDRIEHPPNSAKWRVKATDSPKCPKSPK